jgi:hypothetical protein
MEIPLHDLYRLEGEAGPAMERVKEAMHWLLSPKAEGIGEKLLRDAHELHDKPVRILINSSPEMGYTNIGGQHTIITNPNFLKEIKLPKPNGELCAMSEERMIAHELVHAGQQGVTSEVEAKLGDLMVNAAMKANSHLTPDEVFKQGIPILKAMGETYYEPARQHIINYVDTVALPINETVLAHLHSDPEFISYVKEIEEPAMKVENQIATLRGEPLITQYNVGHQISPEIQREMSINQLAESIDVHIKPKLNTPYNQINVKPSSWQDYIKDPARLTIQKTEHPLIATHKDGGRSDYPSIR